MQVAIYRNPRRGKSRRPLALPRERAAPGRPPENALSVL